MRDHSLPPSDSVRAEVSDQVLTLTVDDPTSQNALSSGMIDGLWRGVEHANAGPGIRAVVVTNIGAVFCSGADLSRSDAAMDVATGPRGLAALLHLIQSSPTPVLGKIDGHAVGGGLGLVAAFDISIARDDVLFGFTEVRVGAIPAVIAPVCLPKMRRGEALEAFLRGNRFSAARAVEIGLLTRATPAATLDDAVDEVVADVLRGGPWALGEAKRLVYEMPDLPRANVAADVATRSAAAFNGPEAHEGRRAFLDKRPPTWATSEETR